MRFDVHLSDGSTVADIEMQTITKENLPKRSRYYQSAIDIATFEKNRDYKTLTKSYIIFIILKNPFPEHNLRKYTFVNTCREEKSLELGDEAIKIFLTPDGEKGKMSEEMEALMSYLKEKKANDEFTKALDEQIRIAKEGSSWKIEYMQMREKIEEQYNAGLQAGLKKGEETGQKIGRNDERIATAKRMLAKGKCDYEDIAEYTGLSLEKVKELKILVAEADRK